METQANSLMLTLRDSTAGLHKQAEEVPFAKSLMGGTLPLDSYKAYLAQRLHFHAALDAAWQELLQARPELSAIIHPEHMQMPYLREDAAFLELAAAAPSAGTTQAIALIEAAAAENPAKLIGHLYVHEGSKNGGMFLSRAVRRMYQFPEPNGTRYLEPYGNEQRPTWAGFKERMEGYAWSDADREAILEGALDGFKCVIGIDAELPV